RMRTPKSAQFRRLLARRVVGQARREPAKGLARHLIGGQRVIDTLGPDDEDIQWSGRFFGAGALSTCLALDSLRAAGQVLPLSYAGMEYPVVIQDFRADIRRLPLWLNTKSAVLFRRTGRMSYWAPLCLASSRP